MEKSAPHDTFFNNLLVESCTKALRDAPPIPKALLQWRKADIAIGKADIELPDLLTDFQDRTQPTRRTIHRVLTGSDRLNDFIRTPPQFIQLAAEAINRCKRLAIVGGIKYQRLGDEDYYAQELFEQEELKAYLRNMLPDTNEKCAYEYVVYESNTEKEFAEQLENNKAIKIFAKLPGWFTVPTPLGSYNPDWAVLMEQDDGERLYFVVETKGTMLFADVLRPTEQAKIDCGREHFKVLKVHEVSAEYIVATTVEDLLDKAQS